MIKKLMNLGQKTPSPNDLINNDSIDNLREKKRNK